MNVFIMQNSIVRPLGRDMQNVLIGFVGEHEARTFFVRTRDDLTGYTISLVIGDVDCGAMTKAPMPDGSTMLSLTLTSDMLGNGGDKVCQLLMVKDTIVRKSSQFRAYVGASNDINSTAPDSATIIIISEKITELVREAALDAIEEVQEVIDSIPADYSTLSAQVDTNTEDIGGLKDDLEDLDERVEALESGGGGLTDAVKTALLQFAQKVAYIDDGGQDYYDALYNALYPPADLVSISAVYTQSGTVYERSSINSLKSDLVVTALMSDQTTQTVTNYTLSGTLVAGTSTITVSYGDKTTTFTVTVSALTYVQDGLVMWLDGEKNGADGAHETTLTTWVDQTGNGWDWTNSGATVGEKSVIFADNAHLNRNKDDLPQNVAMIEIAYKKTTGGCVLTGFGRSYLGNINMPSTSDLIVFHTASGSGSDKNTAFDASANTAHTANSAGYLDGVQIESFGSSAADWQYTYPCIGLYRGSGGSATQYPFSGEIYCIRLYNRVLTEQEILHNASIDMQRFGIGA